MDVDVCNDRPPKTPEAVAPSPWDLRGKIILKGKRHMIADDDEEEEDIDFDILAKAAAKDKSKAKSLKKLLPTKTFKEKAKKQSVSDKLSSLIWMNAGNKKELGELWKNGALPSAWGEVHGHHNARTAFSRDLFWGVLHVSLRRCRYQARYRYHSNGQTLLRVAMHVWTRAKLRASLSALRLPSADMCVWITTINTIRVHTEAFLA